MNRLCLTAFTLLMVLVATPARAQGCDPDGTQESGSKYRICMPPAGSYNGSLVIWAHGFQDAIESVKIPEDQLCFAGTCLPQLITSLGFAFATNSYSKTGLAVLQGKDDILDLVKVFKRDKNTIPNKVYLVGASEGGIITALSVEQHPEVYAGGVAACGPIGNFPYQINYFGDARATFEYFFPGVIGGDPFHPTPELAVAWSNLYDTMIERYIFDPVRRHQLDQWVRVAGLPFDADNEARYLETVRVSVRDVLRYSVVNLNDAITTLGGFPFDNQFRWYFGSDNDLLLNIFVQRVAAEPAAVNAMNTAYATTGVLQRPLVTLHTLRDQQVPYFHEVLYFLKTLSSGSFLTRHFNVAIDRFEHCNFTSDEALGAFAILLFYDGALQGVSGTASQLTSAEQKAFENHMRAVGVPYRKSAAPLSFTLKN